MQERPESAEIESGLDAARLAVDAAIDKFASDVLLLDIRRITDVTDYFVLANGESERQIRAIADAVDEALSKAGVSLRRREGDAASGWVILDFGDIMVHVFTPEAREYYRLERLWRDGVPVVQIQ